MRLNGRVERYADGRIVVVAEEVFSNCPKYIQAREWERGAGGTPVSTDADRLTPEQIRRIEEADTFFIATHAQEGGADASHRGGSPGFVRASGSELVWPDYQGNMMFQTQGNISVNPKAGLVFVDFERGATLQLTGEARIDWDPEAAEAFPGAERLVRFHVDRVVETEGAVPLRWTFVQASPFNP
jgi:predicted pyridoxine 5'-phosphate oxidase superfamily flavin-nucleotide-binding protein